MKPSSLFELRQMSARDIPWGKLLQRLLALTFVKAGRTVSDEYSVEGPDIFVGDWQVEVKTSGGEAFPLEEKDLEGFRTAPSKGKQPLVALLGFASLEGWIVADATGWEDKSVRASDLALRRLRDVEGEVDAHFDDVLAAWSPLIRESADHSFRVMGERLAAGSWRP